MMKNATAESDTPPERKDDMLGLRLDAMFEDRAFKDFLAAEIAAEKQTFKTSKQLLNYISARLAELISADPETLGFNPRAQFEAVGAYTRRVADNMEVYSADNKPNPGAVFWPDPTRGTGRSLFNVQPYLEPLNLIGKDTPVGSAGSCFGEEIAFEFQKRGFTYVVTEREGDEARGVSFSDYRPDNPYARFSANWGILFNTPSFRQLAEKAFGLRQLPRILVPETDGSQTFYSSPYREGVYFDSVDAFDADHDKHIAAVREALMRCKVFIMTLGLNECWEFIPDGSTFSRNPRNSGLSMLIRPKVLTVQENIANIQRFIDIVRQYNPGLKLIISLSPIPFLATTRADECHVISANTHSKAVLRVAAEEIVKANEAVHYFPSFELVTTCTKTPWSEDQRHVSREVVGKVMEMFNAMFVKDDELLEIC